MNNKLGVSAIIGVILMVAMTVAIASAVFVYVSWELETEDNIINSYDNLVLKHGYYILDHSSDYVASTNYIYFVSYKIAQVNASGEFWIYGFLYNTFNDELKYYGNSTFVKDIINP